MVVAPPLTSTSLAEPQNARPAGFSLEPQTRDARQLAPFSWVAGTPEQARKILLCTQIKSWLFEQAIPFWAENGIDTVNGGFVERLTLEGSDANAAFKRTRVTARQVYVFSHARLLGWTDNRDAAGAGLDFLIHRTWQGPDSGFARLMTRDGDVLDPTPDLYDHAFALFAIAWRHRTERDALSAEWTHKTLDFIETHLRHPGGEGFWHARPPAGWRVQNPHMHLTEACLAAFESTGHPRFAEASHKLVDLFQHRLFDRTTGTLAENYDDTWRRAPGEDGRLVEPGHMMEWAWVLNQARKLLGSETRDDIRKLVSFAERHGVARESGAAFNTIWNDGTPLDEGSRIWPNTERIKAAIALHEASRTDPWPVIEETCGLLMSRYLARKPAGIWMDAFDEKGQGVADVVPASTLYHLLLAFSEILRIASGDQTTTRVSGAEETVSALNSTGSGSGPPLT